MDSAIAPDRHSTSAPLQRNLPEIQVLKFEPPAVMLSRKARKPIISSLARRKQQTAAAQLCRAGAQPGGATGGHGESLKLLRALPGATGPRHFWAIGPGQKIMIFFYYFETRWTTHCSTPARLYAARPAGARPMPKPGPAAIVLLT